MRLDGALKVSVFFVFLDGVMFFRASNQLCLCLALLLKSI